MFNIDEDGVIRLTRGDTARLSIALQNNEGEDYELSSKDVLRFTIKKSANNKEFLVQKVNVGDPLFHIEPEDTQSLKYGSYVYDVEITTSEGDVYTIIDPNKFILTKEVTW